MNNEKDLSLLAIEQLVSDYNGVKKILEMDLSEITLAQNIMLYLKKMFFLACASHYETSITESIKNYTNKISEKYESKPHGFDYINGLSFFKIFDFEYDKPKKINEFLAPLKNFGSKFKENIIREIKNTDELSKYMDSFKRICSIRNAIEHNNLILYKGKVENITFEDAQTLHNESLKFVEFFTNKFNTAETQR